jgi:3-oxoacyl-(acyl-carrier-protein) synthase/acyl carrier protein
VQRVAALLEFAALGIELRVYQGSLRERARVATFLGECQIRWGQLAGAIHSAGAFMDHCAFARRDLSDLERVLEPKVSGLVEFWQALAPLHPRRFVLFSSIAAWCPSLSVGIGDYALANGFVSRFADHLALRTPATRVHAIIWSNWQGVGRGGDQSPKFRDLGLVAHTPRQGVELLFRALGAQSTQVLAALAEPDVPRGGALLHARASDDVTAHRALVRARTSQAGEPPRAQAAQASDGSQRAALAWLRRVFSEELHLAEGELHERTDFGALGVDSIIMVEILKRIDAELGTHLEPSAILEYPTLGSLSQHLSRYFAGTASSAPKVEQVPTSSASPTPPAALQSSTRVPRPFQNAPSSKAIAVIGIGCHFPGASTPDTFFEQLARGYNGVSAVPADRWNRHELYSPQYRPGRSISQWGGFITGIEEFDARFFGIREDVAAQVDPLIRQFLEVSVECVADAGYERSELEQRRVGVFVGARASNYSQRIAAPTRDTAIAVGQNFIAAHTSHLLNLRGPALVVDSACSSSLVALHLASQSLLSGESELALAGGVDLLLDESPYLTLSEAKALSPDGRCFTFDARANGFVPGEGAGVVLLKPLERAIADGDRVYAVIEGSAINNDGRTMGITTPNPDAQVDVIQQALARAGAGAGSLSFVEAHGTGTMIGDPIELKALSSVLREVTNERQFCGIGSVKSNIGHLMSAAGIASFIKVALCLSRSQLVPTLGCETPNPRFAFAESPFFLSTTHAPWQLRHDTRRAGISSFGFGGTNAHVILARDPGLPSMAATRQALSTIRFERRRHWLELERKVPLDDRAVTPLPGLLELSWRAAASAQPDTAAAKRNFSNTQVG